MKEIVSGIYKICNTANNKIYIGSAINIKSRWYKHTSDLDLGRHKNKHLQASWNKYGKQRFTFSIIELCEVNALINREQFYIDALKPEYNKRLIAGSQLGLRHTAAAKEKMSVWQKGKKMAKETREKISKALSGREFSEEHKKNMRQNHRIVTEAEKDRLSKSSMGNKYSQGYKHTAEALQKIAAAAKGNKNCLGRKHTAEEKLKMSIARKNNPRVYSQETREKMSKSAAAYQAKKRAEKETQSNG